MAQVTTDPDQLPGQSSTGTDLGKIREAARTKKAVLETQRLERQIHEEQQPPEPSKPRIPAPSSRTLDIEQLIAYWQGVPPEFRARLCGYLYRYWPIIVRTPGYIDKLGDPPQSKEEILRQWGTGEYDLKLTDLDKKRGGELCHARFKFSESFTECPPVVEVIELDMGRKENKTYIEWLRAKGMLRMPGETTNNGNSANDTLVKAVVDMAKDKAQSSREAEPNSGLAAVINALKGVMVQDKPVDPVTMLKNAKDLLAQPPGGTDLKGIAELIAAMKPAPAEDTGLKLFLAQMQQQAAALQEQNTLLLKTLLEQKTKPPEEDSLTKQLTSALLPKLIERALDGGARAEGWLGVFENPGIQDMLGQLGSSLVNLSSGFAASKGAKPVAPAPNGAAANPAQVNEEEIMLKLFQFFQPRLGEMLQYLQANRRGEEFADHCAKNGMTPAQHAEISDIGREMVMKLIRQAPPAWNVIQPIEQQFILFLDQFLAWTPEWNEGLAAIEEIGRPPGRPVQ